MLEDEFRKAKNPSIVVDGKTVLLFDTIEVPSRGKMLMRFLSANSEWKQGVWIGHMRVGTDLRLTVAGQTAPGMRLWEDHSPREVEIEFSAPHRIINIYNIWDIGDGQSTSQLQNAGMLVSVSDDGRTRTYQCNDGHADVTFSHLSFSLSLL